MFRRRQFLVRGGSVAAFLSAPNLVLAAPSVTIEMKGTSRGEHVWFTPIGLVIEPGTVLHFVNRDPANGHTATAYHPDIFGRQLRIPDGAEPWDSDYLLPDESFDVTLSVPGVYDYYCLPHEMAGMVGRILVGDPEQFADWQGPAPGSDDLPEAAMAGFPSVDEILRQRVVMHEEAT